MSDLSDSSGKQKLAPVYQIDRAPRPPREEIPWRDHALISIEDRAQAIPEANGGIGKIWVHFSRRPKPPSAAGTTSRASKSPMDAA